MLRKSRPRNIYAPPPDVDIDIELKHGIPFKKRLRVFLLIFLCGLLFAPELIGRPRVGARKAGCAEQGVPDSYTEQVNSLVSQPLEGYFNMIFRHHDISRNATFQTPGALAPIPPSSGFALNIYCREASQDIDNLVRRIWDLVYVDYDQLRLRQRIEYMSELEEESLRRQMKLAADDVVDFGRQFREGASTVDGLYHNLLDNLQNIYHFSASEFRLLSVILEEDIKTDEELIEHIRLWQDLHSIGNPLGSFMGDTMEQVLHRSIELQDELRKLRLLEYKISSKLATITPHFHRHSSLDWDWLIEIDQAINLESQLFNIQDAIDKAVADPQKWKTMDFLITFLDGLIVDATEFIQISYAAWAEGVRALADKGSLKGFWEFGAPVRQPSRKTHFDGNFTVCPSTLFPKWKNAQMYPKTCLPHKSHTSDLLQSVQLRHQEDKAWVEDVIAAFTQKRIAVDQGDVPVFFTATKDRQKSAKPLVDARIWPVMKRMIFRRKEGIQETEVVAEGSWFGFRVEIAGREDGCPTCEQNYGGQENHVRWRYGSPKDSHLPLHPGSRWLLYPFNLVYSEGLRQLEDF